MMSRSRNASRLISAWLVNSSPRQFNSISVRSSPASLLGAGDSVWAAATVFNADSCALNSLFGTSVRSLSSETEKKNGDAKQIVSYWGIARRKVVKPDGTEWKWSCFMPWESYRSDTWIDLKKHHVPETFVDKLAYWTVKSLRWPSDLFFQDIKHQGLELKETPAPVGYH